MTSSLVRYLFCYLLIIIPGTVFSQNIAPRFVPCEIKVRNYSDEDGLSSKYGFCMLQDTYGYLWFGTQLGLNRFDGYDFISFSANNQDSTSLSHNRIWSLFEDESGKLWICSEGGLSLFNRTSQTFTNYYPNPDNPVAPDNSVYSVKEYSKDNFWVFTEAGLYSFERESSSFRSYKNDSVLSKWPEQKQIIKWNELRYFKDANGIIWIGSMQGLKKYDSAIGEFVTFRHNADDPQSLSCDTVCCITEDQEGNLWMSTWGGGICKLVDKGKGIFQQYRHHPAANSGVISDAVFPLLIDTHGNLWAGGFNGISKYSFETNEFVSYEISSDYESNEMMYAIKEDNSGTIWFTSSFNGVYSLNPLDESIVHYKNDPKDPYSLISDDVVKYPSV